MIRISAVMLLALAGGAQAAPIELSTPERAAAFQAAGFRHWPQGWTRCLEDESASHMWARLEVADLNGDGAPEAWIREGSTVCYGATGEATVLLTRKPAGWSVLLDEVGIAAERKTRMKGWPDIEVGGPGFEKPPLYRFDGTKYVRR